MLGSRNPTVYVVFYDSFPLVQQASDSVCMLLTAFGSKGVLKQPMAIDVHSGCSSLPLHSMFEPHAEQNLRSIEPEELYEQRNVVPDK